MKISPKFWALFLMLGLFTSSFAQQRYADRNSRDRSSRDRVERLQFQLDELEMEDVYVMSKSEKKAWKRKRRKLRAQLKDAQYDEWRYIRATNPYARNNYYSPYAYNRYNSPYFYRPVRRVYVIRGSR